MNTLTTLYQFRRMLALEASDTQDDAYLMALLEAASAMMERIAGRHFTPYAMTLSHTVRSKVELALRDDLLELSSIINGDGRIIPADNIRTLPDGENQPISLIHLTNDAVFTYEDTPELALAVTGIWGWHDHWPFAWTDSADAVQDNPLSSSDTQISVMDAAGIDTRDESPRFQVGHLLRIEAEYLRVVDIDYDYNLLTVIRGVNGTAANEHPLDMPVEVYRPPLDIQMLCLRWANWLYREPDARLSDDIPGSLLAGLNHLKRINVLS